MKSNKKNTLIVLTVLILSMLLSACGSGGDSTNNSATPTNSGDNNEMDKEYIVRFATSLKASELESVNPGGIAIKEFKEYVEKETDGKVSIKLFLGGQLATTNEDRVNGLLNGAFEMENLNCGSWSEYSRAFTPLNAPYLFLSPEVANKALNGNFGQSMNEKLLQDLGIRNLGYVNIGNRQLTNSIRLVKSPEDIKGLKIRTMSDPYQIATWEALGANVIPTAYSELYTALQQGMVDGQENPLSNLYTSGIYEIQPYLTLTSHNSSFTTFVINDKYFQSLPEEYQKVLVDGAKYACEIANGKLDEAEEFILEQIKDYCEIYEPSIEELKKFRDATESVREDMLKNEIGEDYYKAIINEIKEIEKDLGI